MHHTPSCVVDEEEAYLKEMLDAGVIQPSGLPQCSSEKVLVPSDSALITGNSTKIQSKMFFLYH